jgi:hypothetical protein
VLRLVFALSAVFPDMFPGGFYKEPAFMHGVPANKSHSNQWRKVMPSGDKSSYTDEQKRQAEHVEEGYENRGVGQQVAGALGLL